MYQDQSVIRNSSYAIFYIRSYNYGREFVQTLRLKYSRRAVNVQDMFHCLSRR